MIGNGPSALREFGALLGCHPSSPVEVREAFAVTHAASGLAKELLDGPDATALTNPAALLALVKPSERWEWARSHTRPDTDLAALLGTLTGAVGAERLHEYADLLEADNRDDRHVPSHLEAFVLDAFAYNAEFGALDEVYHCARYAPLQELAALADARLTELLRTDGGYDTLAPHESRRLRALVGLRTGVTGQARYDALEHVASAGKSVAPDDVTEIVGFLLDGLLCGEFSNAEQDAIFGWLCMRVFNQRTTVRFECAARLRPTERQYAQRLDVAQVTWLEEIISTAELFERASSDDPVVVRRVAEGFRDTPPPGTFINDATGEWAVRERIAELIAANPAATDDVLIDVHLWWSSSQSVLREVLAGRSVSDDVRVELIDDPQVTRRVAAGGGGGGPAAASDPRGVVEAVLGRGVLRGPWLAFAQAGLLCAADAERLTPDALVAVSSCGHPVADEMVALIAERLGASPRSWELFAELADGSTGSIGELLDTVAVAVIDPA